MVDRDATVMWHTPVTDQSEDSDSDVSVTVPVGHGRGGLGPSLKRKQIDVVDDDDTVTVPVGHGRGGLGPSLKRIKIDVVDDDDAVDDSRRPLIPQKEIVATTTVLTMRVSVMSDGGGAAKNAATEWGRTSFVPPAVGLRLFHDIRDVDKILSLTQSRGYPSPLSPTQRYAVSSSVSPTQRYANPSSLSPTQRHSNPSSLSPTQRHGNPSPQVPEMLPLDLSFHRRNRPDGVVATAVPTSVIVKPDSTSKIKPAKAVKVTPGSSAVVDWNTTAKIRPYPNINPFTATAIAYPGPYTAIAYAGTYPGTYTTVGYTGTYTNAGTTPVTVGRRRKYPALTADRRLMANARERNRTQTVSDAFDNVRDRLPVFSNSQRLSKLTIVNMASDYILFLSRLLGKDYSAEQNAPSVEECVHKISRTLSRRDRPRRTIRRTEFSSSE